VPVAELVRRVAELPLVCQPGQAWSYGVATDVVGHLVSLLADMPFDTFVQEKILEPLGMSDAAFYVPQDKLARLATAYSILEGKLFSVETPATTPYANQNCYANGGSALVATTLDYFRFAQMLLNRGELEGARLLSPKMVDLMTRNHVPTERFPLWFGNLMDAAQAGVLESEGTFGWGGLWGTSFDVDPKEELICLIMKQLDIFSPVPVDMNGIFSTLAYTAIEA
jgi:CubicO group peptidase (beta-lactamase class C family)